jgi:N-acetyl-anhydromuramyl-L-alanine amidase AmpD
MTIIEKPCPNHSSRDGLKVIAAVIHIAQVPKLSSVDNTFASSASQSSAHYCVGRDPEQRIHQYVDEDRAAWHSGLLKESPRPIWKLWKPGMNPNKVTIGIENAGCSVVVTYGKGKNAVTYQPTGPLTAYQYSANAWLVARAAKRWGFEINEDTVVRHGDIYRLKAKLCPGPEVDMGRIIKEAKGFYEKLA